MLDALWGRRWHCRTVGKAAYINGGETLIDSNRDLTTAQLFFAALIKADACSTQRR